jgi:DNA-binding CsgD family transcriptional regulator
VTPGRLAHAAQPDQTAQVRLQAADGTWALVRAAPLTGPQVDGGYAITLQNAPAGDLTRVLMPAWNLTPRECDVASLIIEGRSSDDIAASLFLSPHTVRDHIKAIFGKVGVHNRRQLTAALTGQPDEGNSVNLLASPWCAPSARTRALPVVSRKRRHTRLSKLCVEITLNPEGSLRSV